MDIVKILLQGLLVLSSLFLVLLILMHKGSGGGLSDMFDGSNRSPGLRRTWTRTHDLVARRSGSRARRLKHPSNATKLVTSRWR